MSDLLGVSVTGHVDVEVVLEVLLPRRDEGCVKDSMNGRSVSGLSGSVARTGMGRSACCLHSVAAVLVEAIAAAIQDETVPESKGSSSMGGGADAGAPASSVCVSGPVEEAAVSGAEPGSPPCSTGQGERPGEVFSYSPGREPGCACCEQCPFCEEVPAR